MLNFFCGPFTMALLMGAGIWFTVLTGFLPIRKLPDIFRETVGSLLHPEPSSSDGLTPFQAMSAALAGTMGTGNISGIAAALAAGGPGAVFWMWVSAGFGMATKYAEVALAVKWRRKDASGYSGGPMYYISGGLGWNRLAALFCVVCILASFGIGNLAQSHSMAAALEDAFRIPPAIAGLAAAVCAGLVVWGGIRRIGALTQWAIPLMSLVYLAAGSWILIRNRREIPHALLLIFRGAFSFRAAAGGAAGYTIGQAFRVGIARGLFTNEAGLGSAPIAHASAAARSPSRQGYWGIFEVFADTFLSCTFTALILLTSGALSVPLDGSRLTAFVFRNTFGPAGAALVAVSLAVFAFAALLSWCYYGEQAAAWLFPGRKWPVFCYRAAFLMVIAVSPMLDFTFVWGASDLLNCVMALVNCTALLLLSPEIARLSGTSVRKKVGIHRRPIRNP